MVILTLEYGYLSFIQHLALNRCKECARCVWRSVGGWG